ncbi:MULTISPECIES: threonine/serine exporter family protein [unclassified Jeotgalibaca]|uniref:threonine/serine exporter family protein n=1 Tax=unclassified Jeotgalibaca TaxID=2621505 RepID=UPI003FD546E8
MITIIFESLVAFIADVLFAVLLQSPKRSLFHIGLTGALGWFVYLISLQFFENVVATLLASLTIALFSQYFARILKTPTTIYFLPAFFPLVPGEGIYRAVFSFIEGDYSSATVYLNGALLVSGAIAVSIFLVDSMFNLQARLKVISLSKK